MNDLIIPATDMPVRHHTASLSELYREPGHQRQEPQHGSLIQLIKIWLQFLWRRCGDEQWTDLNNSVKVLKFLLCNYIANIKFWIVSLNYILDNLYGPDVEDVPYETRWPGSTVIHTFRYPTAWTFLVNVSWSVFYVDLLLIKFKEVLAVKLLS